MSERKDSQQPIPGDFWSLVSIGVFIAGVLLYKYSEKYLYAPDAAATPVTSVSVVIMLAGLVSAMAASVWGRARLSDKLGEMLGLKRGGEDLDLSLPVASLRGAAGGIPVKMKVIAEDAYKGRRNDYGANFSFEVGNPENLDLAVLTEDLADRPLGIFPPEIKSRPQWMQARRLELRAKPADKLPALMEKLEALKPLAGQDWQYARLSGSSLEIRVRRRTARYSDAELKALLDKASRAAALFNQ